MYGLREVLGKGAASGEHVGSAIAAANSALLRLADPEAQEARLRLLRGAAVLFVGAGYPGKRFVYERAAELGARVAIADEAGHWSQELITDGIADRFLTFARLGDPDREAEGILRQVAEMPFALDAVCTFWEDTVPVVARVAAALGLPGNDVSAVDSARSKRLTREASARAGLPTPSYSALDSDDDLADAAAHVGFPAIIKPEFGAEALGCYRVDSYDELVEAFARIKPMLTPELDPIFVQGSRMLLEHYLDGTEFDVDFLLSDRECVYTNVSENWPTNEPYFGETGLHSPSSYPRERLDELTKLCVGTTLALGFRHGVFHVEAKYTSRGPRILEVNARMGGTAVRDLNLFVREVDLVTEHLLTTAGIPIRPCASDTPRCGVCNFRLYADRSGRLGSLDFYERLAADPRIFFAESDVVPGDPLTSAADGFPTVLAELALRERDAAAAVAASKALMAAAAVKYV
jgi:carnosine synthase